MKRPTKVAPAEAEGIATVSPGPVKTPTTRRVSTKIDDDLLRRVLSLQRRSLDSEVMPTCDRLQLLEDMDIIQQEVGDAATDHQALTTILKCILPLERQLIYSEVKLSKNHYNITLYELQCAKDWVTSQLSELESSTRFDPYAPYVPLSDDAFIIKG